MLGRDLCNVQLGLASVKVPQQSLPMKSSFTSQLVRWVGIFFKPIQLPASLQVHLWSQQWQNNIFIYVHAYQANVCASPAVLTPSVSLL